MGRWEAPPVLRLVLRQVDVEPKREAACFVGQGGVHKSEGDIAHVEQVGTVWLLVHIALRFGERVLDIVNLNIQLWICTAWTGLGGVVCGTLVHAEWHHQREVLVQQINERHVQAPCNNFRCRLDKEQDVVVESTLTDNNTD